MVNPKFGSVAKQIIQGCVTCHNNNGLIVDKFSQWVQAYPTHTGELQHTAIALVKDFIPRWGLMEHIDSDQGTHFTGAVCAEIG